MHAVTTVHTAVSNGTQYSAVVLGQLVPKGLVQWAAVDRGI